MSEHLSLEAISALLDAPDTPDGARGSTSEPTTAAEAHLEACAACRAEYERMSRMRMALSAIAEAEPPADEWARVLAHLEAEPPDGEIARPGLFLSGVFSGWPLRAAAAFLLFAGGVLAGLQLTESTDAADSVAGAGSFEPSGRLATGDPLPVAVPAGSMDDETYLRAIAELREMGAPRWAGSSDWREASASGAEVDPVTAAERLARLDALIHASRQAVEESPADPVANGLLFQLVDERNALASRLRESLHLASLEYR